MAPQRSGKQESSSLINPLLAFVDTLPFRINSITTNATQSEIAALQSELTSHINTLRTNSQNVANKLNTNEWQKQGIEIWNVSTRLGRTFWEGSSNVDNKVTSEARIYGSVRTFAFFLLDCAYRSRRKEENHETRLDIAKHVRIANKAAKTCLNTLQLGLCTAIFERAADLDVELSKLLQEAVAGRDEDQSQRIDEHTKYRRLQLDYCALRIVLAFKQDNLDLAESMFLRIEDDLKAMDMEPARAEELADLMYEVGQGFAKRSEHKRAAKWLHRSLQIISAQDSDMLSPDAGELKLSIMNYLTRALIQLDSADTLSKARTLVDTLEASYDDKMVVAMLRLDLLLAVNALEVESYSQVLNRLIRIVHLTNVNCNTVMSYVHKLRTISPVNACRALDDFLTLRFMVDQNVEWAQKVIITRLWISIENLADDPEVIDGVRLVLDSFMNRFTNPFDAAATHAAHVLLWKRIKVKHKGGHFDQAESWALLGLHEIFSNAGEYNAAVLIRRVLLCQLERHDLVTARATIGLLSDSEKSTPSTRFLMYKFAIKSHDADLASECLDIISQQSSNDSNLLYACVLEAQNSSDKSSAIAALRKVLLSQDHNVANGAQVPTLLRCLARLLQSDLPPADERDERNTGRQLCEVFETAASHVSSKVQGNKSRVLDQFTRDELHWFMKHSYNLGLQYYGEWPRERSLRMLESCIVFMNAAISLNDFDQESQDEWIHRFANCHVLVVNALTKLARAADDHEAKLRHYRKVEHYATSFGSFSSLDPELEIDLARELVKCHFEAAVQLQNWDSLVDVANQCRIMKDQKLSQMVVDMTLSQTGRVPTAIQLKVLEMMVAATDAQSNPTVLSRWLRVAYTIFTQDSTQLDTLQPANTTGSRAKQEMISAHALSLAQQYSPLPPTDADPLQHPQYPAEEIECFATTVFNRAIDAYCASDDETCQRLADLAVEFAKCVENVDGGALREALIERKTSLRPASKGEVG